NLAGKTTGLALYPRLMSFLISTDDLEPRVKVIGWVLKVMDGMYDARQGRCREQNRASFAAEEDCFNIDAGLRKYAPFPAFAYQHVKNRHGIMHMVRSVCLDLVCNVQFYRSQNPEVEVFARFLEEFYGPKELCFFLDLRAEAHRVARVCTKRKAVSECATQTVWMTLPDCVRVATEVFLDKSTLYFRDLIATVEIQARTTTRAWRRVGRISLSDFLYLAMVCFVSPKEPEDRPRREKSPASVSGRRVYHGGASSARGGNRRVGQARTTDDDHDGFDVPSPASLASGDRRRCFFRPLPESTSSRGGEKCDHETIEAGRSTARGRGRAFSCRKKKFGDDEDERCSDAMERDIWATWKALEMKKALEASALVSFCFSLLLSEALKIVLAADLSPTPRTRSDGTPGNFRRRLSEAKNLNVYIALSLTTSNVIHPSPHTHLRQERHISMTHNLALKLGPPEEGARREGGTRGGSGGATGDHPTCSRRRRGMHRHDIFTVKGERRGANEERRLVGNDRFGRLASNTQEVNTEELNSEDVNTQKVNDTQEVNNTQKVDTQTVNTQEANNAQKANKQEGPFAASPASSRSTCVSSASGEKEDDGGDLESEDEKNIKIGASGGGGGRAQLCGYEGRVKLAGRETFEESGRRLGEEEPGRRLKEDYPPCFANASDGGDGNSSGDGSRGTYIGMDKATGVGEGARVPKESRPRPHSADGLVPPSAADAPSPSQQGASFIRATFPGGTERSLPRNTRRSPGASEGCERESHTSVENDCDSHRPVDTDYRGEAHVRRREGRHQTAISDGKLPAADRAELDGKADVRRRSGEDSDEPEIRSDVLAMATEWLASFKQRFLPSLPGVMAASSAAKGGLSATRETAAGNNDRHGDLRMRDGALPAPIARVLSEEMVRVLALRRRDLDAIAHQSPQLLSGAVAEAFRTIEDAVSTPSSHSRALCNMGRLLEDRENVDAALLCFQAASAVDTASAEALFGRARNLQRRGDLDGAVFYFEGALARSESHWSAWYGLGQVKAEQGKHADAVEAFSRWVDGEDADNRVSGGRERGGGGGAAAASRARGLVQLGDAQRELGQDTHAQRSYERAISVDESLPELHFKLGSLLQARGGHDAEALEAFARAVRTAA
ncbi:unnamed protein product, partial [Laminaria digitata]